MREIVTKEGLKIQLVPYENSKRIGYIRFEAGEDIYLGSLDEKNVGALVRIRSAIDDLLTPRVITHAVKVKPKKKHKRAKR